MKHSNKRPLRSYWRSITTLSALTMATALTAILATSASASGPTNVLLGTSSQFAVLAGSQITNTGVTTISGDTGSTPTSVETGFGPCPAATCVSQVGANHTAPDPNDGATQNARADLITAYADAAGRSPSAIVTELAGQNLVAGVYKSATGTFGMSGNLILNGANNADSVFIFQMDTTLTTASAASVTLINGAQACNVYWQVGSAATLGSSSTLVGTVLAHDDINLGDSVTVDGRLLAGEQASGNGEVTMIHDTITKPSSCVTQASVDAALAAQNAANAAAQAAQDAKNAADKAAADEAAATKAAEAAKVEATRVAAEKAAKDAADAAAAAKKAKDAAKLAKTKAAATKAARVAKAKALVAQKAATRAAKAAKVARAKVALAKKKAATSTFARPHTHHVGLTG